MVLASPLWPSAVREGARMSHRIEEMLHDCVVRIVPGRCDRDVDVRNRTQRPECQLVAHRPRGRRWIDRHAQARSDELGSQIGVADVYQRIDAVTAERFRDFQVDATGAASRQAEDLLFGDILGRDPLPSGEVVVRRHRDPKRLPRHDCAFARIAQASSASTRPARVNATLRLSRSNSETPSSDSSDWIARVTVGCATLKRSPEVEFLGNSEEVLELPQFHSHAFWRLGIEHQADWAV